MNTEYTIDFNGKKIVFDEGDFVLLCGKSGSGKTTLLNIVEKQLKAAGKKTGFVFQNFDAQIVTDKVWHELAFGMENNGYSVELMHRRAAELASYFGINDWLDRPTQSLSGGQKQLLNLASVMALKPEVLILDEPVSQLDPVAASNFINTVKKLNKEFGITVIISEHRVEELFADAERIILLDKMNIKIEGNPQSFCSQIIEQGDRSFFEFLPVAARIALRFNQKSGVPLTISEGRKWLKKCVKDGNCAEGVQDALRPEWSAFARNSGQPDGVSRNAPAITLKNISYRYEKNGPLVLNDLNLEIIEGEIFAVTGANGSGKSTLLKIMAGLAKPSKGKVNACKKVLMMSQNVKYTFAKESVKEELAECGWKSDEYGLINFDMNRHPYDLSGGEMQKLALAKILAQKPQILLLDEPTKGMDNAFKKEMGVVLRKIAAAGVTVVIVCHDLEFCAMTADRAGIMFEGQILGIDSVHDFFADNNFYTTVCSRLTAGIKEGIVTEYDF